MTDTIGDMLTRLKNALDRGHDTVSIPYSKTKTAVLDVIKNRNLITEYTVTTEGIKKNIIVTLKYNHGKPAITDVKRISKPGKRVYADYRSIPVVKNNYGFVIISTSKGIMDTFTAKKNKVGGEIMCELI